MTSAAATLTAPPPAERTRTPLAPRLVEFLLVGGATLFLLPLAYVYRDQVGLDESELFVSFLAFHAAHVINDPHFSVTYLLFYRNARERAFGSVFPVVQRVRYWIAGLVVPIVLAAWVTIALARQSGETMGLLMQVMFFLVGWHYVKQGFGVLTVLSARRGIRFTLMERRVVLAHCFSGWAYGWATPVDTGRWFQESGVVYQSIAHPPHLDVVTGTAFGLSTIALGAVMGLKWRRERRPPAIAPLSGLLVSIWLWTVYSSLDPLVVYVIPGLHAIQYLYFVWLLERNRARAAAGPPLFDGTVARRLVILAASALALGWLLFRGAPSFLDATFVLNDTDVDVQGGLGATPHLAAFVAFVNIHHYFMDHVIWRRENPDVRHLTA